jgi:hypothetical protein
MVSHCENDSMPSSSTYQQNQAPDKKKYRIEALGGGAQNRNAASAYRSNNSSSEQVLLRLRFRSRSVCQVNLCALVCSLLCSSVNANVLIRDLVATVVGVESARRDGAGTFASPRLSVPTSLSAGISTVTTRQIVLFFLACLVVIRLLKMTSSSS